MNKIKKIAVSIIILLISILAFCTNVNAYNYTVGTKRYMYFNRAEYADRSYLHNQDIFCLNHDQRLWSEGRLYEVISIVDIQGNKSTDHTGKTIISADNARMAYILSANNPVGSVEAKHSGVVANGIWKFMPTWMESVGKQHAGLYSGLVTYHPGEGAWEDTASGNYANQINDLKMTDNTDKSKIKVTSYEKDGQQYMRIGPFNWTFSGSITNVVVKDQNNNNISNLLFSSYNGNNEYWYSASEINSGRDFYVSIPANAGVTKITKISGTAKVDVKGVKIWFLKPTDEIWQNLIIREPYGTTEEISSSFDYDILCQGSLKVIKVDQNNQEVKLKGVGFKIQNKNTGKYVKQDSKGIVTYVDKLEEATEFITDSKGEITIKNLIVGTYIAYETKNPNYGYEIITDGREKQVTVDKTAELKIPNQQKYIKLSGYVWVDKISGKQSVRNDLYKNGEFDSSDILLDGVTVRLKDRTTGGTVKETKTSNGGAYQFEDILIEKLSDYYIEFEYDGLTYTNVIPYIDKDNGSKSAESIEIRETFNKGFSVVEGNSQNTGFTKDENNNQKYNLSYNISEINHEATLINNGQYTIIANTDTTGYKIIDHFTSGQTEIKYINLGLYERESPDIALVKDIQNVRVTVNGYEHTYNYAQRFKNEGEYGDGFNVGIKFGEKYGNMTYSRAVYKSDSDYEYINEKDKSKELNVYVTYKIAMSNQSSTLITQVNSIVDYFDNNYSIVGIGTKLDEKGNIADNNIKYKTSKYNDEYQKAVISNNTYIKAEQEESIYVQFALNREAVLKILNDQENLNNVAEINSYSVFDENGKLYAGIDTDSNPGNCIPGKTNTYEDDTDSSPALKLEVADSREMSGTVFLDSTSGELMTGEIRQGDGKYTDGESGIKGVKVTLTENTGSGKVYTAETDENGNFIITGFIPGDYTLTYTWGNETYTVQNYKGTIFNQAVHSNENGEQYKEWYKKDVNIRYTDAIDNYNVDQEATKGSRQQIDNEMKSIKQGNDITRTQMDSTTPTMGIGVEYDTTTTASVGDKYTYRISNIDFGIVERARQDISLTKRVKTMKVTLANGQVITDLTIGENGEITGEKDNIAYMAPSVNTIPQNGFVKLELDNELIQGAVLEVGYEIKATNNSELDYLSEEYYKYGTISGNVVTIKPTAIIDYLDKDWAFDSSKNTGWEVKTLDSIKDKLANIVYEDENSEINENTILYTESLKEQSLKPTDSASIMLNVSKTLTNSDDISLDNETEIVEVNKDGGSNISSTPGNYIPGSGKTETDDYMAETVIITPNTGDNQNYIMIITLGISALVILGSGVIIIKKKVLNR